MTWWKQIFGADPDGVKRPAPTSQGLPVQDKYMGPLGPFPVLSGMRADWHNMVVMPSRGTAAKDCILVEQDLWTFNDTPLNLVSSRPSLFKVGKYAFLRFKPGTTDDHGNVVEYSDTNNDAGEQQFANTCFLAFQVHVICRWWGEDGPVVGAERPANVLDDATLTMRFGNGPTRYHYRAEDLLGTATKVTEAGPFSDPALGRPLYQPLLLAPLTNSEIRLEFARGVEVQAPPDAVCLRTFLVFRGLLGILPL